MNIRVDLNYTIKDGSEIVFRSPVDCSAITGLVVYYVAEDGSAASREFVLTDAHGNDVGDIDHLFSENVVVKVILDVTAGKAYVQNADTNAYIERTFIKKAGGIVESLAVTDLSFKNPAGDWKISACFDEEITDENGRPTGQVLVFYGAESDEPVVLRGIHDPVMDHEAATKRYVDRKLAEVGNGSGQNVTIDTTLTVDGAAADAKAVGDALGNTQPKGLYVQTVNGAAPDAAGNINFAVAAPDGSIAVDPTLSVAGAAADAAAVGAAIAKQADIIYGPGKNIIDASKVIYAGNGRIHDTTGELMSGSTWVFGDYYLVAGETYTISKAKGSQFLCFYNADGSYAGLSNRISVSASPNTLTFVAPAPMMRIMAYSDIATINLQIEAGDTATDYEAFGYALKESMRVTDPNVVNNLLAPGKVDNRYVADNNLALQKMNFAIATYNLVDPLACVAGYLSTAGNIMQSSSFLATDYIPVSADDGYVRTVGDWVSCAFYNASKGFLSIVKSGNSAPIPANAAYVRVDWTGFLANAARYCVYVGAEEKPYIPYRVISQTFVEQAEDAFPEVRLVLPRDVYVANGVRVDIHAQSITRGIDVRNLVKPIATSNGAYRAVYNHIEITGGEKTDRSFDVYCETTWGKFALKNISVHNVPADAGAGMTKRILFIGDSKTDAGVYTQCLLDLFASDSMSIQLLGTRGTDDNRHEGRSGWSAKNYVLNDAYRGVIEDSPFYNPTTQSFDFSYYMGRNGYDGVDFVFINLGTNDADDSANFISYYNTMIDGIRSYNPNVIIGIWVPAPFATFGGYSHVDNDAQTFDMMEAIIAEFDTPENQANRIFVVPTHMNLNTEYDYPWRDEPYTREKPEHTYRVCTDQIHEVYGYYKDANVIFGYIKHFATL